MEYAAIPLRASGKDCLTYQPGRGLHLVDWLTSETRKKPTNLGLSAHRPSWLSRSAAHDQISQRNRRFSWHSAQVRYDGRYSARAVVLRS